MLLTIDSAGRVLALFTNACPERGVTEVAGALGVSKSKAHALLASLTSVGLLRRTHRGRYRVGWRVLSLNRVLIETTDFHTHARPVMQALGQRFGELVHLGTLDEGKVVYIDRIMGTAAVRIDVSALGSRLDAHCSAVGKALLANLPSSALDDVIEHGGLPAVTARTITDRARLDQELATVRERGFATEQGEAVEDVCCVAAPIFAPGPTVVAAISVAAPAYRFRENRQLYTHGIVRAATYITRRVGDARDRVDQAEAEVVPV
ncbi:MAG: IclR family transcriptional regulator [Solirubrobacteraceae bacterium]